MTAEHEHRRSLRSAHLAPLEPSALTTAERFRAMALDADAPDTGSVARRMAAEVLTDWGLSSHTENVALCLSELVGNVVQHSMPDGWMPSTNGERRITIAFRAWPKWLFVEVSDDDSTPPMLPAGDLLFKDLSGGIPDALLADNGRGLLIVQALSDATWWAPREEGGKSVFCRFDLSSPPVR